MIGQVYIEGDLRVAGVVEGEVEVTGNVEIDDVAKVKASVSGGDVSVRGHLTGPVVARKRLIVARSGALIGDVRAARLVIQDGATFSGKISMGGSFEAPAPAKPAETPPVALPEPEPEPQPMAVMPEVAAVKPASEPKPQAAVPAPAPVKPTPAAAAPMAAARADGGKVIGKAGGKAKAAPPPKGKPKRR